jgi:hypothetical protein
MLEYPKAFDDMLVAWSEPHAAEVRGHLEKAMIPEVQFVDPKAVTEVFSQFD